MVDYQKALVYADFWRNEVMPYLRHMVSNSVTLPQYLEGIYRSPNNEKTFGMPLPYIYTLEWLKKYQNKCVTFYYNSPEEVARGSSIMTALYQLSRKFHVSANIHLWYEEDKGESDGHVTCFVVYEELKDVHEFVGDNEEIIKQSKAKLTGFVMTDN